MNISKRWKEYIVAVVIGIIGNAIWALIRTIPTPPVYTFAVTLIRVLFFVAFALICIFIGRQFGSPTLTARADDSSNFSSLLPRKTIPLSTVFVLEVSGSQPLDSSICDWRFFLTNCTNRMLRKVTLSNIQSDLGTYLLGFQEIPFIRTGEKITLQYQVRSRRMADRDSGKRSTLWDFANDITGGGRSSYIWYKIQIEYRESEDETVHSGDFVCVCFDLPARKLKTEGAEYYLKNKYPGGWEP